jgi:hypothetical protein
MLRERGIVPHIVVFIISELFFPLYYTGNKVADNKKRRSDRVFPRSYLRG